MTDTPTDKARDLMNHAIAIGKRKRYLGDAVWAEWDGYQIRMWTEDGNDQVIYLDDTVVHGLKRLFDEIETAWKMVRACAQEDDHD